jgi:uncharacterized protein
LVETFVLQELRRQTSWHPDPVDFFHYRDRDGFEVDIVLERGSASVAGVEVKAAACVTEADFRGLRKLRDAAGRQFAAGVVLYDGASAVRFGDNLFAVPWRILGKSPRPSRPPATRATVTDSHARSIASKTSGTTGHDHI